MEFVRNERISVTKSRVSLKRLKEQALIISKSLHINHFRLPHSFVDSFVVDRNGLSYRSTTHRAQTNKKTPDTKFVEVSQSQYLNEFNTAITDYEPEEY